MAAKRRARRPRSDDSMELGRDGGDEGSDGEETAMSGEPKEMPLKQEQPSPSPAMRGGVAMKTKTTASKHVEKSHPASQAAEDGAGDSGDASPARGPLPADAGHSKRAVTLKRGPPPPQQGEERPEKRPARSVGGETAAASGLLRLIKAEMAEEEQSNTSPPQDGQRAREEEEQHQEKRRKKMGEQSHAGDTSSPPHDKDKDMHRPRASETEKQPWSCDDELKILKALVEHAQSHNGALPDSAHLLANLTFDKTDATEDKLTDKIRKLRRRHNKFLLQGSPSDHFSRRLFKLSQILWGKADEDERVEVEPTSRDVNVLSRLYPHLAKEVKAYAETHSSGLLIMAMFMNIGDEKARDLDAKCKKQHIEAFKLELGQASLTNELLSALSSLPTEITDPSQATPRKRSNKNLEEPLDEQHLRRSKRVAGMTEGFKDKPNAYVVFDPKPPAMAPAQNSPAPDLTKEIVLGIAAGFGIHPRDVRRSDQAGHR